MPLAASILDDADGFRRFAGSRSFADARGPAESVNAEPKTPSAWKLDAMAIAALAFGGLLVLFLKTRGM